MLTAFAIVLSIVLVAYWARFRSWSNPAGTPAMFVLLPLMIALLIYTERSQDAFGGPGKPVLLVIAADVSLSMGTLPEPAALGDVGTRLQRAQQILLPFIVSLGASTRPAMVSVTAFTSKAETILAWDDDLALVREIVEYVLSTGLLTEAGSDLGVALQGVTPLYESLPDALRGPEQTKYLLLVSDGEQTAANGNSDLALAKLKDLGVKIISLYVGLPEVPEGLPVYDDNRNFVGFEEVGGKIFSVSDPDLMSSVAGNDPDDGLFVRADSGDAAAEIMDFIGLHTESSASGALRVAAILVLWGLLTAAMLRWV